MDLVGYKTSRKDMKLEWGHGGIEDPGGVGEANW